MHITKLSIAVFAACSVGMIVIRHSPAQVSLSVESQDTCIDSSLPGGVFDICPGHWRSDSYADWVKVRAFSRLPVPEEIDADSDADVRYAHGVAAGESYLGQGSVAECERPTVVFSLAALNAKKHLLARRAAHLSLWTNLPNSVTASVDRPSDGMDLVWDPSEARSTYERAFAVLYPFLPVSEECRDLFNQAYARYSGDSTAADAMTLFHMIEGVQSTGVSLNAQTNPQGNVWGNAVLAIFAVNAANSRATLVRSLVTERGMIPIKQWRPFVCICAPITVPNHSATKGLPTKSVSPVAPVHIRGGPLKAGYGAVCDIEHAATVDGTSAYLVATQETRGRYLCWSNNQWTNDCTLGAANSTTGSPIIACVTIELPERVTNRTVLTVNAHLVGGVCGDQSANSRNGPGGFVFVGERPLSRSGRVHDVSSFCHNCVRVFSFDVGEQGDHPWWGGTAHPWGTGAYNIDITGKTFNTVVVCRGGTAHWRANIALDGITIR